MVDVIFKGVGVGECGCKFLNSVEVMIVFDNLMGVFVIDIDEIYVICCVYCGGEGEYFINGEFCWFKDICDFFCGMGVVIDVYSLIE